MRMRKEINIWAAAGALTAAALPIGPDAIALCAEEVVMIIRIGSAFGVHISKSAALGLLSSQIATAVGQTMALAAFEAANVGYPFTIPIKSTIAAGLIKVVGEAAYNYFEHNH